MLCADPCLAVAMHMAMLCIFTDWPSERPQNKEGLSQGFMLDSDFSERAGKIQGGFDSIDPRLYIWDARATLLEDILYLHTHLM